MGFLGLGEYTSGKGVKKETEHKRSFFQFFGKFFRHLPRMIKLHILYLLFCIPIITIGPATVALVKIMHMYIHEKPVFLFADFLSEFKKNFKQGFWLGLINISVSFIILLAIQFYAANLSTGWYMYLLVIITSFMFLLYNFSLCYSYLLCSLVNMKLFHILKNSFLLGIVGVGTNFVTILFNVLISLPAMAISLIFPPLMLIFAPHAVYAFSSAFNSFQYVYKFIIKPYYEQTGTKNPYEKESEQEVLFTDAVEIETVQKKQRSKKKIT